MSNVIEKELGVPFCRLVKEYSAQEQIMLGALAGYLMFKRKAKQAKTEYTKETLLKKAREQATRFRLHYITTNDQKREKIKARFKDLMAELPRPEIKIMKQHRQLPYVLADSWYLGTLNGVHDEQIWELVKKLGYREEEIERLKGAK